MFPQRQTIVLVDDDAAIRRALARLLRSFGLDVVAFASAEELLAAPEPAAACRVLDVHLPGLSGPELHARLRAEGRDRPTIFVTAFPEEAGGALAAGALAVLEKPFRDQDLLDALARALGEAP
jgi:FixJ family two-component response regulator